MTLFQNNKVISEIYLNILFKFLKSILNKCFKINFRKYIYKCNSEPVCLWQSFQWTEFAKMGEVI